MAKVLVNESSLTGIADAIRGKNGSTTTYKPSEMAAAITAISGGGEPVIEALSVTSNGTYTAPDGVDGYSPVTVNVPQSGGPEIPDSAFVISGKCMYWDYYGKWDSFITAYKNKWSTRNIQSCLNMFEKSQLTEIPFEINFDTNYQSANSMFKECEKITKSPKLNNLKPSDTSSLFNDCIRLRTIPNDFTNNWNFSYIDNQTSQFNCNQNNMFYSCYSLRSIPIGLISHGNKYIYYNYSYFYNGFTHCYALDELVNLPIPYTQAKWSNNSFSSTFSYCERLKNITFAKQADSTPYTVNWSGQTITLTSNVGYATTKSAILNYNSGITADKEVTDATTYAALKNDPDWWTVDVAYSRYNHDSAVATINSLPDTSAYLASAGGTNTIKFKGAAGSATDGGAINTLTEEEIAVATAKGWTVTLV